MRDDNVLPFGMRERKKKGGSIMVRGVSIFLGLVLLAMFIVGIAGPSHAYWLIWLDLVASACAFAIAGAVSPTAPRSTRQGSPIALSVGLFVLWIIALASTGVPAWLTWFNFGVACVFLVAGLAGGSEKITADRPIEGGFRRSA
jgi:hypothetical protein